MNLTHLYLDDSVTSDSSVCQYLLPLMMINNIMSNLQSLKLDVLDLIPINVLDEIAVMSSLAELDWVNCGFGSDKTRALLGVYEQISYSIMATSLSLLRKLT